MARAEQGKLLPRAIGLAVIAGVSFTMGAIVGTNSLPTTADWLSFAGALVGAAVTIAGSIYVLDRERGREERERRELLLSLLDDADKACEPFQVANENVLQARYGVSAMEQAHEVEAAIRRIHAFREKLEPTSARMLKAADAIDQLPLEHTQLIDAAKLAGMYPDSADFGHLNYLGHEIREITAKARALLVS